MPTSLCRQQLTSGLPRSKLWNIFQIFCARKQARPMRFLDLWSFLYEIFVPSGPYTTKLGTYYWEEPFFCLHHSVDKLKSHEQQPGSAQYQMDSEDAPRQASGE